MDIQIQKEQADLKTRQEAVVKEINQNVTQQQQLEARRRELIKEADMLNGEARMLNRLGKNTDKPQKP